MYFNNNAFTNVDFEKQGKIPVHYCFGRIAPYKPVGQFGYPRLLFLEINLAMRMSPGLITKTLSLYLQLPVFIKTGPNNVYLRILADGDRGGGVGEVDDGGEGGGGVAGIDYIVDFALKGIGNG